MVRYTPTEEGVHAVKVSYDGHPVPGSPFPVEASLPPDPSKVRPAPEHSVHVFWIGSGDGSERFTRSPPGPRVLISGRCKTEKLLHCKKNNCLTEFKFLMTFNI